MRTRVALSTTKHAHARSRPDSARILMVSLRWTEHARRHPEIGKRVPEKDDPSIRELAAPPYRVFYRPGSDCIEVLAIVHGRQNLEVAF